MNDILVAIGLGVALSIDCFFVLTLYSYCNKNKQTLIAPFIIGALHIIFPMIMYFVAKALTSQIGEQNWIPAVAFIFLGIQQFRGDDDEDETCSTKRNILSIILLAVSVSLDSVFMGMSLAFTSNNILLFAPIFGLVAFTISGTAVLVGRKMSKMVSVDLSKVCGLVFFGLAIAFYFDKL